MNHIRYKELLIDAFDGTVTDDERTMLRQHLTECSSCREDEVILRSAGDRLRNDETPAPSSLYFVNLLPNIRKRMEIQKFSGAFVPIWIQRMILPVSAATVVLVISGLFTLLSTEASFGDNPLHQLIVQLPQDEIDNIPDGDIDATLSGRAPIIQHQHVLERVPNVSLISQKLEHDFIKSEIITKNLSVEILPVESAVENLSEEEVSLVIDKLTGTISL